MGIAADGDSLVVSAACVCTSMGSDASVCGGFAEDDSGLADDLAIERTTSFLHIGQVRRRVVSHGVLRPC